MHAARLLVVPTLVTLALSATPLTAAGRAHQMAFVTAVTSPADERKAMVLVDSIRAFGGPHADAPIYVVQLERESNPCRRLAMRGVTLVPLELDPVAASYPYAYKAYAAAEVERLVAGTVDTLVWMDPGMLLLGAPTALRLNRKEAVALRPVYLVNTIGQPPEAEPDAFWARIYDLSGADWRTVPTVEEYATGQKVRGYYTCIVIAFRPERGICREWARVMDALLHDAAYQKRACSDRLHRIFLHQAALCGVIAAEAKPSELRPLPDGVGYPYNLHQRLPEGKRFARMNDATAVVLENAWDLTPAWMDAIQVDEPLRAWLTAAYRQTLKVTDRIWREEYSCNSYLVKTASGSVMIDPGGASSTASWLLKEAATSPVRAILLTHGHDDHRQGIALWKPGKDVPVIAQREHVDFLRTNDRLAPFYAARFAAQNGLPNAETATPTTTPVETTVLFDDEHALAVDDLHIRMVHTGGETPDTSLIWIPELAAAFIGDNYYTSFPNLYTLRGTRPRWALDYVKALDLALELGPELLLPGHGEPVVGREEVRLRLQRHRDAIVHVHDAVVAGMNAGKDVHTLMREIRLPETLSLPEGFGRVSWSVRGIFDGYAGWFDGNPSSMYAEPASSAYPELVALAGGPDAVTARARAILDGGDAVRALHLTDMALAASPGHRAALEVRLAALGALRAASQNYIESQWLAFGVRETRRALETAAGPAR